MNYQEAMKHIRSFPFEFWVVLGASLLNQIGNMGFVFLVLYCNEHLGYSLTHSTFAFAVFGASMLITGLTGGSLVDKLGAARLMIGTLIGNGCVLLIFPIIHAFTSVLIICILWGFFYGLYRPAAQTFVSHLSSTGLHKITFSLYRLIQNLGMSIGPALGGYLALHSFATIFYANGIANILAALILLAGLYHSPWMSYRPTLELKLEMSVKWLFRDRVLRLFVLGMIPISMVFFQHESTLSVFLNHDLKFPMSFYGLLFTLNTLIIVFFELPLNVATLNWPYYKNFMLGSLFITIGFGGLTFAHLPWHIVTLAIIWTVGEMILYPSASSYIADIAPIEQRGNYMSLYSTCSNMGMVLGPWGGSFIMEYYGANGLWVTCIFWGILSIIIFQCLKAGSNPIGNESVRSKHEVDI